MQGEFDQKGGTRTNWGTKEELLALIKLGNEHGIVRSGYHLPP